MKACPVLLAAALTALLLTACGTPSAAMRSTAEVVIAARVEPESLAVGETTLIVTLTDSSGSHIEGARLQVHANMDHAGMMPVDREVSASVNGEYLVPFEWTMGGGWIVVVTAQLADGGETSETFEFFVEAVSSESVINRHRDSDNSAVSIAYQPDNDPAFIGDGIVTIRLADADGSPVTDALVEIVGDMAHAGMMPISGQGQHTENGRYTVPLRWTMAGDWQVTVKVTLADGRQFEQTFDQRVVMR